MLIDSFGRLHDYLRISLTDNCNFRCAYCMPHEELDLTPDHKLMQADEVFSLAKIFVNLGVKKIRLTGGEPLMRRDFRSIVSLLKNLPISLHLTTNGVWLHKHEDLLQNRIFSGINISLDTLQEEQFALLTKRDAFQLVWDNVMKCINLGIHLKLNVVLLKGINDKEVRDFIELTRLHNIHVRFIEFMPFDSNQWSADKVITSDEIMTQIQGLFDMEKLEDQPNDTDTKYKVKGGVGSFAFISTLSHAFCHSCNRLRLTADGKMKNCLFGYEEFDLLTALRNGEDIEQKIRTGVYRKAAQLGGQFDDYKEIEQGTLHNRSMIKIGG